MLRIAETFFQGCFAYLIISLIVGPRTLMRFIYYVTAAEDWYAHPGTSTPTRRAWA